MNAFEKITPIEMREKNITLRNTLQEIFVPL